MIHLNRIGDVISGSVNMKTFGVKYTEARWKAMSELKTAADDAVSMVDLKAIIEKFELLTHEDYKTVIEHACKDLYFNEGKGTFHLKLGKKYSKMSIPQPIVDRILKSFELKMDFTPLVKFCIRAMRPVPGRIFTQEKFERIARYVDYKSIDVGFRDKIMQEDGVSREVATERATVYQTPITMEGLLCTYKVSSELLEKYILDDKGKTKQVPRYGQTIDEDTGAITKNVPDYVEDRVFYPAVMGLEKGDAFFCDRRDGQEPKLGHLIRVGCTHFLERWDQIDQRDTHSCVKGLHVGNLDYIRGYESFGTTTHNVFVSPEHIGAITDDGSGALRVFKYFVHSSKAGENRGVYHSSVYGKEIDAEWVNIKAEIAKDLAAKQELLSEESDTTGLD